MKLKDRIITLMTENKQLRDDDIRLHQAIRREDVMLYNGSIFNNLTGLEIQKLESIKVITPLDAVTRIRRKIQEENVSLRGNTYIKRQQKANRIRKEINK